MKKSAGKVAADVGIHHSNDDLPAHKRRQEIGISTILSETRQFFYNAIGDFSLRQENLVGVDITPHTIRLCKMDHSRKKPKVKNLASATVEKCFILDDIFANSNTYIEKLRAIVEEGGMAGEDAVFSVPVSGAIIHTLHIPELSDEELQKPETLRSLWHVSLAMDRDVSEYAIAVQVISRGLDYGEEYDPSQRMMEVVLVAVQQSIVAIFSHILKSAGLNPTMAVLRCLALENALESMRQAGRHSLKGSAFLEFGSDENYLFIPDAHGISTYDIYLSSADRVSLAQNTRDSGTLTALTKNYAQQIQQFVKSHERQHPETKVTHIYVTSSLPFYMRHMGEMPVINNFIMRLASLLEGYNVSECVFCEQAKISGNLVDKVKAEGSLSAWVTTMGLANSRLDAFGRLKKNARIANMNMLPEAAHFKKVRRIKILSRIFGIGVLIELAVLMAAAYAGVYFQERKLAQAMVPFLPVEQEYTGQMAQMQKLQAMTEKLDALNAAKENLPSNQRLLLDAYHSLGETIPDGVWLKQVTFQSPKTIEIEGNSVDDQNILEFINALNSTEVFGKVSLRTMQAVKETIGGTDQAIDVKKFKLDGEFRNEDK